jgi:hypothetical protein
LLKILLKCTKVNDYCDYTYDMKIKHCNYCFSTQNLYLQTSGQTTSGTSTPALTHAVVTKGAQGTGQTLQRVIPVQAAGQQQLKQTYQV